ISNTNGQVTVLGDQADNSVTLKQVSGTTFQFSLDGGPQVQVSGVTAFSFRGSGGDDTLVLDATTGNPIPSGGVRFDGEGVSPGGSNQAFFQGSGTSQVTVTPSTEVAGTETLSLGGRTATFTGVGALRVEDASILTLTAKGVGSNLTIDEDTDNPSSANR